MEVQAASTICLNLLLPFFFFSAFSPIVSIIQSTRGVYSICYIVLGLQNWKMVTGKDVSYCCLPTTMKTGIKLTFGSTYRIVQNITIRVIFQRFLRYFLFFLFPFRKSRDFIAYICSFFFFLFFFLFSRGEILHALSHFHRYTCCGVHNTRVFPPIHIYARV